MLWWHRTSPRPWARRLVNPTAPRPEPHVPAPVGATTVRWPSVRAVAARPRARGRDTGIAHALGVLSPEH